MIKEDRELKQMVVTCPIDGGIAQYVDLIMMGNANYRMYRCIDNKEHDCFIDEDLFWNDKA